MDYIIHGVAELDTTERLSLFLKDPPKDGDGPGTGQCVQEKVSV